LRVEDVAEYARWRWPTQQRIRDLRPYTGLDRVERDAALASCFRLRFEVSADALDRRAPAASGPSLGESTEGFCAVLRWPSGTARPGSRKPAAPWRPDGAAWASARAELAERVGFWLQLLVDEQSDAVRDAAGAMPLGVVHDGGRRRSRWGLTCLGSCRTRLR
jgi:hypothetical protein